MLSDVDAFVIRWLRQYSKPLTGRDRATLDRLVANVEPNGTVTRQIPIVDVLRQSPESAGFSLVRLMMAGLIDVDNVGRPRPTVRLLLNQLREEPSPPLDFDDGGVDWLVEPRTTHMEKARRIAVLTGPWSTI